MNRLIRLLVILLALGATVTLALLPVGRSGQGQHGLFASLISPSVALARIRTFTISNSSVIFTFPGISEYLELDARGHEVEVQGHITCDPGELFRIDVKVNQLATEESDGALAEGRTHGVCTGEIKQVWTARAKTQASTVLQAGEGRACAAATTQGHGPINDAYQWCKDVVLE